jgi:hypothetical protein
MSHKCRDCKDTKIYQGLGAPEPCKSCRSPYDEVQRPPRLNHASVDRNGKTTFHIVQTSAKMPGESELMRLINEAVRMGAHLDEMLRKHGLDKTVTH